MKNLTKKITAFLTDEQGAETVEWVIVVALVVGSRRSRLHYRYRELDV